MDLGHCARNAEDISSNNKRMNRALGLIVEKLETKYGSGLYQKLRFNKNTEKENAKASSKMKTPVKVFL